VKLDWPGYTPAVCCVLQSLGNHRIPQGCGHAESCRLAFFNIAVLNYRSSVYVIQCSTAASILNFAAVSSSQSTRPGINVVELFYAISLGIARPECCHEECGTNVSGGVEHIGRIAVPRGSIRRTPSAPLRRSDPCGPWRRIAAGKDTSGVKPFPTTTCASHPGRGVRRRRTTPRRLNGISLGATIAFRDMSGA
jgi:hypothetical protein